MCGIPRTKALVTVAALAATLQPLSAPAQWPLGLDIEQTPHNLRRPAGNQDPDMADLLEDYGEICVYCHTPHGGNFAQALWNRRTPVGPFRMYDRGTDMVMDAQPTGNTLACLSCHDGTIGLDDVINAPNAYTGPPAAGTTIDTCESCHSGGNPDGGIDWEGVWLDTDLRNHHPISILYDPSQDPTFHSAASVTAAGLVLYEGKVQCMTCHEPHSQQFYPFLRAANSGGSLCLVCHMSPPGETTAHDW